MILIVAGIWIGVFFKTFTEIKKEKHPEQILNDDPSVKNIHIKEKMNKLDIDFSKNAITDPFRPFNTSKKLYYKSPVKSKNTIQITAPAYLLQGIVWDLKNPKAILILQKTVKVFLHIKLYQVQ